VVSANPRIVPVEGSLSRSLLDFQPSPARKKPASGARLRILHLLSQQPAKTGSGVALLAMVRHAAESGHIQHAVIGLPAEEPLPAIAPLGAKEIFAVRFDRAPVAFNIPGMSDVMPYPSTRFSTFSAEMLESYLLAFSDVLEAAVANFEPDLIHSNHLWLMTALARTQFPQIPLCVASHGTELRQLKNAPQLAPFVTGPCSAVDMAFALHPENKQNLMAAYGLTDNRVRVVGAGYRDDFFNIPTECVPADDREVLRIVYAGKISAPKGVPWLIDAMDRVRVPPGKTVELLLAGTAAGPERDEIQKRAARYKNVKFLGALSQEALAGVLQQADVFVLPSFFEGLPLVVIEAMACGCRAVMTDLPGLDSWLPDGLREDEYVSPVPLPRLIGTDKPVPGDLPRFTQDLADALSRQLDNAVQCGSAACAAGRLAPFSWRAVYERVEKEYFRLTKLAAV
jgi:glycosyltransferase involved in cell wall biosynthesis